MPRTALALHVIERGGNKGENLTRVDGPDEWESGNWKVSDATAASLIGGRIFLHKGQKALSHIGGVVLSYRDVGKGRKTFRFRADTALTNVDAGGTGWGNEKKIVWDSDTPPVADPTDLPLEDEESAFPEGAEAYKVHRSLERDTALAARAKQLRLQRDHALRCEACDFDFAATYGDLGAGYIEAHHTTPVSQLRGSRPTKVSELALVCANCHRMLHRSTPLLDVAGLRRLIFGED